MLQALNKESLPIPYHQIAMNHCNCPGQHAPNPPDACPAPRLKEDPAPPSGLDFGVITGWEPLNTIASPMVANEHVSFRERLRNLSVRWAYKRHNHRITPGLYSFGAPDGTSPVLVTANYKLTFDKLRSHLSGLQLWILVLDTKGINVWCAAGKGTFGTNELVNRIRSTGLARLVTHRTLILPQLGAPGVAAQTVEKETGFRIKYGPVYARDIPRYLANGMRKTGEMRTVHFTLMERLSVVPVEMIHALRLLIPAILVALLLGFTKPESPIAYPLIVIPGCLLIGTFLFAALLPYLPSRAFSSRGAILGVLWSALVAWLTHTPMSSAWPSALIATSICAYLAMNFTGCSTFTSQKGTEIEVRLSLPWILSGIFAGVLLPVILTILL
ncbi:MAG: mercury methylation corrinoid protein HgcA [Opitutales bacterium]|nr:mercury methylation corrinoid protein HgcA [Opitutales bacterium]